MSAYVKKGMQPATTCYAGTGASFEHVNYAPDNLNNVNLSPDFLTRV